MRWCTKLPSCEIEAIRDGNRIEYEDREHRAGEHGDQNGVLRHVRLFPFEAEATGNQARRATLIGFPEQFPCQRE